MINAVGILSFLDVASYGRITMNRDDGSIIVIRPRVKTVREVGRPLSRRIPPTKIDFFHVPNFADSLSILSMLSTCRGST